LPFTTGTGWAVEAIVSSTCWRHASRWIVSRIVIATDGTGWAVPEPVSRACRSGRSRGAYRLVAA